MFQFIITLLVFYGIMCGCTYYFRIFGTDVDMDAPETAILYLFFGIVCGITGLGIFLRIYYYLKDGK